MSSFLSELGGITAGVGAEGLAFAAGFAAGHALRPEATLIAQDAWHAAQLLRLDPATAAEAAVENYASYDDMANEATYSGLDATRFAYLYDVTLTAPGVGELLNMLRRHSEVKIDFEHGLRKAKLEGQWDKALRNLRDVRIPGPDLAYMVVRGVVPDGGTLPSALPTSADKLQLPPQLTLDTLAEASKTGWDAERFAGLVARSGLAMAPVMAAQANFRGILTDNDYLLTIARGDLFPAYADPVREASRQILTSGEYAELQLRGFYDEKARRAHTAKHGMTDADSDLLYNVLGRSIAVHAVTTGLARGGKYPSVYADVPQPYRAAIQRSNIREEWVGLAYANRYSYPSAFVIRSLATSGEIDQPTTKQILLDIGWPPELVDKVVAAWFGTAATGGDKHVAKAETQLWTTTHRSYIAEEIDDPTAQAALAQAGVAAAAIPAILALWNEERSLIRKQLTPTQIRKALGDGLTNPATGAQWTVADATAAMLARGYSQADAQVFLQE